MKIKLLILTVCLLCPVVAMAQPKAKTFVHPWQGKHVGYIGDSISDPNSYGGRIKQYWYWLQQWLDITPYTTGVSGRQWNDVKRQADKLKAEHGDSIDAITVFLGTNDFNSNVPVGEWYTEKDTTVWEARNGKAKSEVTRRHRTLIYTESTYRGRINISLDYLKRMFPTKQIVLLTPLHRGLADFNDRNLQPDENYQNAVHEYIDAYVQSVIEAGRIWGVPVIDLHAVSGLNPMVKEQLQYFWDEKKDQLHPNTKGHQRIARTMMYQLLTIPVDFE